MRISFDKFLLVLLAIFLTMLAAVHAEGSAFSISAVPASGKAPLDITFSIITSEEILSVSWDFESDGTIDSTEASPHHTYETAGMFTAQANVTTASGSSLVSTAITVDEPFSVSVVAAPTAGIAPLTVQFTTTVTDEASLLFSWDFNGDGDVDSTEKNPTHTFETAGNVSVQLIVQNAEGKSLSKRIPITVRPYDSKLQIVTYFPTALQLKENQMTFLITNGGSESIKDLSAKIIGPGIQHLSSTAIARLKPGEEDSVTVKFNALRSGNVTAFVKIDEKSFPISFFVTGIVELNKEELEAQLAARKQELQVQEDLYYEKKAENFLVAEIFEGIKATKKQLQDAQQQLLTNKLEDAQVNLDLAQPAIEDIARRLETAKKPEQTLLLWLKDNALAITAIVAAFGTLSGILVKVTGHARKLGEDVKEKLRPKKEVQKEEMSKKEEEAAPSDDERGKPQKEDESTAGQPKEEVEKGKEESKENSSV